MSLQDIVDKVLLQLELKYSHNGLGSAKIEDRGSSRYE